MSTEGEVSDASSAAEVSISKRGGVDEVVPDSPIIAVNIMSASSSSSMESSDSSGPYTQQKPPNRKNRHVHGLMGVPAVRVHEADDQEYEGDSEEFDGGSSNSLSRSGDFVASAVNLLEASNRFDLRNSFAAAPVPHRSESSLLQSSKSEVVMEHGGLRNRGFNNNGITASPRIGMPRIGITATPRLGMAVTPRLGLASVTHKAAPLSKSALNITRHAKKKADALKKERIKIQVTTFTNWFNSHLKLGRHDRKVVDLSMDLQDGILLIRLLENLTKKKVKNFTGKVPKTEAHKLENLTLAFQIMRAEKIKLIGVGAINVYQGNVTLILGMIWMLIQKYQIRIQSYKVSTKKVMMSWLQALLLHWNITNLIDDWKDGMALTAVINTVKPGIGSHVSTLDPTKHRQNCTQAIKFANTYLKVPQIISPDDLSSGNIDELSMMTYLSCFVEPFRAKLLKWVSKVLPQFKISGFSSDWYNGKAFGALMEACFPDSFTKLKDYEDAPPRDYIENLLKAAQKRLQITPPFTADDLGGGNVEELQIMTMISLIKNGELASLPDEVVVQGPGIDEAHLHKETSFTIDTSEAGPGDLFIDAHYEEDGKQIKFSLKEKSSRVFSLTYRPPTPGTIIFEILWSDVPIPQSPLSISVIDSTLVKIVDFESHNRLVDVGKPLSLLLETKKAGHGKLSGYLQYSKDKVHADVTVLSDGMMRLDFTPTKPGSPDLHVFWNKEEMTHLTISYTVVDSGGYQIESFPRGKVYGIFEEVEFSVFSSKRLPLNVLQMTAILDFDLQIPIHFKHIDGHAGYASFKPTLPGCYSVEVVCANQLIQGTPFSVKIIDPQSCKLRGEVPPWLQLGKSHVFEVDAADLKATAISFRGADGPVSTTFKTEVMSPDSSDTLKLAVTPLAEGDFTVGIMYQIYWIANSPFKLRVCDPSKFKVVEMLNVAYVGKPVEFSLKTKEKCSGELKPVIKARGPSAIYSPQVELKEDSLCYSVKFTPWEMGDHEISITYGEFDIVGSPITLPVKTYSSTPCSASGSGLQRAFTGIPTQFQILSKEEGLLEDGTLKIEITSVISDTKCKIRARDNKDGTYGVAYLLQTPGAYLISITAAQEHIPGSPFRLNALPGPKANLCEMYGPALNEDAVLTYGKPIDFTVDTSKAGSGKLTVKAIGPGGVSARVFIAKTQQPGKYDINLDPPRHGKYRVSVKWSGQNIPGSPATLKVFPGADARKCIAHGPGLEDGLVGKKSFFTIETKDAGAGMLRVRLHGLKGAFKIEIAPKDQKERRTLLAKYDPTQPGEYLIRILWSDIHIPGSPFRVKITGDGTSYAPVVITPTPRLPEPTDFFEEDNVDNDDSLAQPSKALVPSRSQREAPNSRQVPSQQSKPVIKKTAQKPSTSKKLVQGQSGQVKGRVHRKPQPQHRKKAADKGEFHGQATLRMKSNKSKFTSK